MVKRRNTVAEMNWLLSAFAEVTFCVPESAKAGVTMNAEISDLDPRLYSEFTANLQTVMAI
jgi:hypothetical protein